MNARHASAERRREWEQPKRRQEEKGSLNEESSRSVTRWESLAGESSGGRRDGKFKCRKGKRTAIWWSARRFAKRRERTSWTKKPKTHSHSHRTLTREAGEGQSGMRSQVERYERVESSRERTTAVRAHGTTLRADARPSVKS